MSRQLSGLLHSLVAITAGVLLAPTPLVQAQSTVGKGKAAGTARKWTPPHTPDGQPDLQWIWTSATLTPLELARKRSLTAAEASAYEKQLLQQGNWDRRDGTAYTDLGRAYNEVWFDRGTKVIGSSWKRSPALGPPGYMR